MKTIEEVLEMLQERIDRQTLEEYIAREWLQPVSHPSGWYFEDIDIARIELVCHLTQDIQVNDEGMDVVLSLLDQLYGARAHMQKMHHAISQQSPEIQTNIMMIINTVKMP
jgi:chaperone modulatory protein CbpM